MNKHLLTSLNIIYWTIAFAFLAFFIAVEIPKKGVNWSDLGLYYAISNNYLFGQFNEYGLAGLLNALLIKIHFGYLNLSRFFYFLQFITGFLFVIGLRMRATFYWVAPIAVTLMLASTPVNVLSYESAGPIFLLLALSILFISINYKPSSFWNNLCYGLSAFLFCYSSVTNLILVPSLLVNGLILFFIYPKITNKTFIITYIISSLIGLYFIIFKVYPLFELTTYYYPGFFIGVIYRATLDLSMLIGFVLWGFFSTKLLLWISEKLFHPNIIVNKVAIYNVVLIICTSMIWYGLQLINHSLTNGFSWFSTLLVYSGIYLGVLFAIYGWRFYKDHTQLLLGLALLLCTEYYLAMTASTEISWVVRSLAHASEITLIVLIWLEYFFMKEPGNTWVKMIVALILLLTSCFYPIKMQTYYNAFGQYPPADTQEITNISRLNGIYTDPDMLKSLHRVIATYNQYDCKDKLFISRDRFPLLYYIFNRIGYSPFFYLDSERDLDKLKKAETGSGYCYFGDFIFEKYAHSTLQNATMTKYRMLYDWLQKYSKKIIYIPVTCIGCAQNGFVKVYVG